MKQRLLSLLMAAAMVLSMASPAYAIDATGGTLPLNTIGTGEPGEEDPDRDPDGEKEPGSEPGEEELDPDPDGEKEPSSEPGGEEPDPDPDGEKEPGSEPGGEDPDPDPDGEKEPGSEPGEEDPDLDPDGEKEPDSEPGEEDPNLDPDEGEEFAPETGCTCETPCAEGSVNNECPVCSVEGANLAEVCKGEKPAEETCICDVKCTADAVNKDCPACGAEGADLTICQGAEKPACICETRCTPEAPNSDCPVCSVNPEMCAVNALVLAVADDSLDVVYVSASGNDETGTGAQDSPVASLAKAVTVAADGGTIYILSDIEASSRALLSGKTITIDGNGHTVSRVEGFERAIDQGRGGYHSAMIEVANQSILTLTNITLDDKFLREADDFSLAGPSTEDNTVKVHDGIIASYGDGHSTIVLGSGTTLKNFGGLSAVYITGEDGAGATLIMKSGSKICDDTLGSREGGYGAIFNHGGTVEAENGSSIESIDGRAIYADNGGVTNFAGTIKDITSNEVMKESSFAVGNGFSGMAYFGQGHTQFTLGKGGEITDIKTHDDKQGDVVLHLIDCTFKMEEGSELHGTQIVGIADMNGATVDIAGSVYDCDSKNILFRLRGTQGTFYLRETGSIRECKTTDAGIIYLNGGKPTVEIAGTIDSVNKDALFMSNNGSRKDGSITLTETGVITNVTGCGMKLEDPSHVTIEGTITNCSRYALQYHPKGSQSLLTIKSTATIEGNNGGKAQIRAQNTLPAADAQEHIVVEPGGLDGNKTVSLIAFDVTIDEDYELVRLGNANSATTTAIKDAIAEEHSDWTVVGSSAVWIQPSVSEIHFTVPRKSSMKRSSLYVALIRLNEDGTPVDNAELILQEVKNTDPVDVTLTGLTAGQSYAMMFVNGSEYTLAPDDITIYTGGGQGNETYDDGGFPALTILNSVDDIDSLVIDGQPVTEGDLMAELLDLLEVTYTDENGKVITHDRVAGEYTATLSWKDGQESSSIKINGNDVADTFGTGTLIVRHIQNKTEATVGSNTYELRSSEPTEPVEHAEAIAKKFLNILDPSFYTNNDENREVDAGGIQILDDSLLVYEGEDRQGLMEEKAEEYLGAPKEGQAYRYQFHYLDLVDAYNGNAWVSASYGTTVYLPYPEGVTKDTADDLGVQVIHYKDLHREYGITGQDDVAQAIADCEMETITPEFDDAGIKFDVPRSGFSPFAVVWQTQAHTITATAGAGGSIAPSGKVTVAEGADQTFAITPDSGYAITDVKVDGNSIGVRSSYTFEDVKSDHTIEVTFRRTGGGGHDNDHDDDRYEGPDLTVVKVDEDGQVIETNARFRIYKKQGGKTLWYRGNQSWSEDISDAWIFNTFVGDGAFTAYDLKPGTYYVEEISAPAGYDLAEDPLKVEIENRDKTVEFVNYGDGVVETPTKPIPDTGR